MKFLYRPARKPTSKSFFKELNDAAQRLHDKLLKFDFSTLNISDYNRNYLVHDHLNNLTRTLQKYTYILANAVHPTQRPLSEITFLEYGGGVGILSLLAREAGIGTVLYNDIYDVSCVDAKIIGAAVGCQADHYIHGDIDDVITYLRNNKLTCHAIASYDVIEHVYDIESFLKKIPMLSSESHFTVFMSSGANTYNPRIKRSLHQHHHEHEYKNRTSTPGHKQRDSLQSFFAARKDIITEYDSLLSADEVTQLAKTTRGKIKEDIYQCVDHYKKTKTLPAIPTGTDTCDPYTGNWSEHLMDPYHLKDILQQEGFTTRVVSGYYGHNQTSLKNYFSRGLNIAIDWLPTKLSLQLAPFYTIFGVRV